MIETPSCARQPRARGSVNPAEPPAGDWSPRPASQTVDRQRAAGSRMVATRMQSAPRATPDQRRWAEAHPAPRPTSIRARGTDAASKSKAEHGRGDDAGLLESVPPAPGGDGPGDGEGGDQLDREAETEGPPVASWCPGKVVDQQRRPQWGDNQRGPADTQPEATGQAVRAGLQRDRRTIIKHVTAAQWPTAGPARAGPR